MADRVEAGVPEQDATPPTPRVARDGVEPAFQKQDREELKRQGRARLSLGKRKLPERLWERRLGREPGLLEEVSQVLHHVPGKQLGDLWSLKLMIASILGFFFIFLLVF